MWQVYTRPTSASDFFKFVFKKMSKFCINPSGLKIAKILHEHVLIVEKPAYSNFIVFEPS
jgi:hypothetical protein